MPLTRDQRRAMERSLARMNQRQSKRAAVGQIVAAGVSPEADIERAVGAPAITAPNADAINSVAGRLWWHAQNPNIRDDQRDSLMDARTTLLRDSVLA